jgi:excisionase family DNA binding protein
VSAPAQEKLRNGSEVEQGGRRGTAHALRDLPPTITVEHAARLCGIGRNAAYRAAASGELPTIRLGRRLLVPTAQLLRLLGVEGA